MTRRRAWKKTLLETAIILFGTAIMAFALVAFLIPHRLAAGGISGLAVILFYLFRLPVGLTIIVLNIPLFLVSYFYLGSRVLWHSLLGTLFFSGLVELFDLTFSFNITGDILLAAVYGGVLMGFGLGLVFRARGSTGGTSLISLILSRLTGISTGQGLLGSDLVVILLAFFILGAEPAMYAVLSLFVSSWVIDAVQEGLGLSKAALIITARGVLITDRLLRELDRGVTALEGRGGFTGHSREVLLCVIGRPQVAQLKEIVHEADPDAFLIIGSATEVYGEGFRRHFLT